MIPWHLGYISCLSSPHLSLCSVVVDMHPFKPIKALPNEACVLLTSCAYISSFDQLWNSLWPLHFVYIFHLSVFFFFISALLSSLDESGIFNYSILSFSINIFTLYYFSFLNSGNFQKLNYAFLIYYCPP